MFNFVLSMEALDSIQVNEGTKHNGIKSWKNVDSAKLGPDNPPPVPLMCAPSVAFDPTIIGGDSSNMVSLIRPGGDNCPLLSAALSDLQVLGLDTDIIAKRQLFAVRSAKREFQDRELCFQPDGGFIVKESRKPPCLCSASTIAAKYLTF